MQVLEGLKRKQLDARCLSCFTLERSAASVPPHGDLTMAATVTTATGVREEFTCNVCGQRMVRFLASQTTPRPADVWRYEGAADKSAPESKIPLVPAAEAEAWAEPQLDSDPEEDSETIEPGLGRVDSRETNGYHGSL